MTISLDKPWCDVNNAVIFYRAEVSHIIYTVQHIASFLSLVHALGVNLTLDVLLHVMCLICLLTAWVIGEQSSTFALTSCQTACAQPGNTVYGAVAILNCKAKWALNIVLETRDGSKWLINWLVKEQCSSRSVQNTFFFKQF